MPVDVLILSYSARGRDFEAFLLLKYHLEVAYGLSVDFKPIRDLYWIDRLKPRVLVVTDTKNPSNIRAARYAKQMGIGVATIEGEGIINPALIDEMIWGWNDKHEIIEDVRIVWSERSRRLIAQRCPELEPNLVVCGAGRFDRYLIYDFMGRKKLLSKYGKGDFRYVVGYAGWGFSRLANSDDRALQVLSKLISSEASKRIVADGQLIAAWLTRIVSDFPDVLFIFKQHPGDKGIRSEIPLLTAKNNVLYIHNEEKVENIINAVDLWMDYVSTTCLEAWLMGKETATLIPSQGNIFRLGFEAGSLIVSSYAELRRAIATIGSKTNQGQTEKLRASRQDIIVSQIGWSDGRNSLRAAKEVSRLVKSKAAFNTRSMPLSEQVKNLIKHLAYSKVLNRSNARGSNTAFTESGMRLVMQEYYPQIRRFMHNEADEDLV